MTGNIESRFDMKDNRICLITKQEGEEVRLELLMFSVTEPCHAGLFIINHFTGLDDCYTVVCKIFLTILYCSTVLSGWVDT